MSSARKEEGNDSCFSSAAILLPLSKSQVLGHIRRYKVAHFAYHGQSLEKYPSGSPLLFQGTNGTVGRLTVREILTVNHQLGHIAHLSACSTTTNSGEHLVGEVFNVASSFQLARSPHVLGSLWEAVDVMSPIPETRFL